MSAPPTRDPGRIAVLNDLLQLDHDALQAYQIAIDNLENESWRESLRQFRADHERHVEELTALIHAQGGTPAEQGHLTTGVFKQTLQQLGRAGGDTGILIAYETNERQVRDKYWRHAERPHPPEVQTLLRRNAADEERHYSWVIETLRRLGSGPADIGEQVRSVVAQVQARVTDLLEGAERMAREQVDRFQQPSGRDGG